MRLICPNCDAEYEVPDEVIPPEGRDVQCSNCGHTWYHAHPDHPELAESPPQRPPAQGEAPETEGQLRPQEPQDPSSDRPAPARREIDPAVADILREEAEREARLRAREAGGTEGQPPQSRPGPDPEAGEGLDERRRREARERMARIRGEDPAGAGADAGSRRSLLPDIEEINSSLRPGDKRPPGTEIGPLLREEAFEPEAPEKGGFLRGFSVALAVAAVLAVVYARSEAISAAIPALDPALSAYAGLVDQARVWLEDQAMSLLPRTEP